MCDVATVCEFTLTLRNKAKAELIRDFICILKALMGTKADPYAFSTAASSAKSCGERFSSSLLGVA